MASNNNKADLKNADLKNKVLKQLYFDKSLSNAELRERLGKSTPLISKAVSDLIAEGLVVEQGYAQSSGGRRPLVYSLHPEGMFILSVAMDQLITRMVIVDMQNKAVSETAKFGLPLQDNPQALPELVKRINEFVSKSGIKKEKIIGVGIGMPGFIDTQNGINYTFLHAGGEDLRKYIGGSIGLPVYIDNDSSLVALAELKFGAAKSRGNAMVVNVGWGIGLGMILNGALFRGHTGFAGEFSHIPITEGGTLCECGKHGCLETESSLSFVTDKAFKEIKAGRMLSLQHILKGESGLIADAIIEAANRGDQNAVGLFSEAGYVIGRGLAILIHIMNPEIIILSGKGASVGRILLSSAQQALYRYAIPRLSENTELQVSELGYDAELIGAATLVIDSFDKIRINKQGANTMKMYNLESR